jgi:hypothetical protein
MGIIEVSYKSVFPEGRLGKWSRKTQRALLVDSGALL